MNAIKKTAPDDRTVLSEEKLFRRVILRIIPFLFIAYVVACVDRINIGFAQLLMKDELGFSDAVYGLGAGIFFIGYFIFEVPSNLLLSRIGARRTFMRIMICWGAVSTGMAFVQTPWQLYLMRFLLGVFEAGFFPGIIFYFTYWFPASRRATVASWMFVGTAVAGVLGGIISGAIISHAHGLAGLKGWQWMFILEGLPAVLLGFAAGWVVDDGPESAKWLSADERRFLLQRLSDDRQQHVKDTAMSAKRIFSDFRVYVLSLVYFSLICGSMAINFWIAPLIKSAGAKSVAEVGYLTAIPYAIAAVGIWLISKNSDRLLERRWHYLVCTFLGGAGLFVLGIKADGLTEVVVLLSIATTFSFAALPIFWSIPQQYMSGTAAAGGIAIISSLGQLGSFFSPTLLGWIRATTGRLDVGMYFLGTLMILGGFALFAVLGRLSRTHDNVRIPATLERGTDAY